MRKRRFFPFLILPLLVLSACQAPDVAARDSAASFDALLKAMPDYIMPDDSIGGYALEAPDGSARFLWSQDFNQSVYDAWLETDITPFVEAGLDTARLPEDMVHEGLLLLGADFGSEPPDYSGEATPQKAYEQIVKYRPDNIHYLPKSDHYGISLGGGHMFQWAKNLQTNDKDIVFVLDPQLLSSAGADPNKVPGWMLLKVETIDGKGNKVQADKLLKPFPIQ